MGLTDWDTVQPDIDLGWREQFVWPCVRKALGLQWEDQYVRNNGKYPYIKLADGQLDIDEYIRQYVFWQYGQYLY